MKKLRFKSIVALFFCLAIISFSSCSKDSGSAIKTSDLIGTWKMSEYKMANSNEWITPSKYDLDDQAIIAFTSDYHTNACSFTIGKANNGNYFFSIKKHVLILRDPSSNSVQMKLTIDHLNQNELAINSFPMKNSTCDVIFKRFNLQY